jgi:hypothetical protein
MTDRKADNTAINIKKRAENAARSIDGDQNTALETDTSKATTEKLLSSYRYLPGSDPRKPGGLGG